MGTYRLFRYTDPDGSTKDWAIRRNADGTVTTRYGKTGPVLQGIATRHADMETLIRKKERKGYVLIKDVDIDDEGRVLTGAPRPKSDDRVYWRVAVYNLDRDAQLGWARRTATALDRAADLLGLPRGGAEDFEPGAIGGWMCPSTGSSGAGQARLDQGMLPFLALIAMKVLAPDDDSLMLSDEDGTLIETDLRRNAHILARYGEDLDSVRPMAEASGLLSPRINLAAAIPGQDCWF